MSDEEGGVDDRTHQRRNIKPFNGKRASPPDQRQSEQLEAGIARDYVQRACPVHSGLVAWVSLKSAMVVARRSRRLSA
jgi:hypothetical protein